jgi:hypothetical protein
MTSEPSALPRRRRWLIPGAVLSVLVAVALVVWWVLDGRAALAHQSWQAPPAPLLSSPMQVQPVAGWRASVVDLGLPAPLDATKPSMIGDANDPVRSRPLIGNHDDHAYFLASTAATPGPQWWLTGIDVRNGQRLFAPVKLGVGTRQPQCFLNGPTNLLCLDGDSSHTAYVVNVPSGTVSYSGPTDLRLGLATLAVEQIGDYAVAKTDGQGVYGIGQRAETTWFVPGNGRIQSRASPRFEPVPQVLGAQLSANPRDYVTTVFALADGKVVKPEIDDGAHLAEVQVYAGGFAAEVFVGRKSLGVQFFDDHGKRLDGGAVDGSLQGSAGLPIVGSGDKSAIYSPDGRKLIDLPHGTVHLVGSTAFVNEATSEAFPMWRQYDLKTGTKGPACDFNLPHFLGINGSAMVFATSGPQTGFVAKARDMKTCGTLWTLRAHASAFTQVWRINDTLVQLSDDGTELVSLAAPH